MLKTIAPSVSARPVHPRVNRNEFSTDGGDGIGDGKIDDRLANLSSSTKKINSKSGFLTSEASLAFT